VLLVACAMNFVRFPSSAWPYSGVTISFVCYTNDASGTQLTMFAVTNGSRYEVLYARQPAQIWTARGWVLSQHEEPEWFVRCLQPSEGMVVAVAPPPGAVLWRTWYCCVPIATLESRIHEVIERFGIRYHDPQYRAFGPEMKTAKPAAPNPAIASRVNLGHHRRGVGELNR
jgi:hypothetical protein